MLSLIQNSFLNTASSMFIAKMQGTIVDLLVAPLSPGELLTAFTLAAVIRGFLVGAIVWLVAAIFTGFSIAHPLWTFGFALMVSIEFALFGLVVAIWSDKFEQLNLIPTFVITPLTFLGGVFYSAHMLPQPWSTITKANPVLYMVEGLRYGILGQAHASPWVGLVITAVLTLVSGAVVWVMLARGYKLRG
jgi:ABC-2 type transport system permease protein